MYLGGEPIAGWEAAEQARYHNHLLDRRDQAWRVLQQEFLARLRSGELIATGYEEPLSLGSERKPVPCRLSCGARCGRTSRARRRRAPDSSSSAFWFAGLGMPQRRLAKANQS
jgi:hypothetical protein